VQWDTAPTERQSERESPEITNQAKSQTIPYIAQGKRSDTLRHEQAVLSGRI